MDLRAAASRSTRPGSAASATARGDARAAGCSRSPTPMTTSARPRQALRGLRGGGRGRRWRPGCEPRTAAGTGCAPARPSAADEKLVYARSTDVTELKRVEAEREELLRRGREPRPQRPLPGCPTGARWRSSYRGRWRAPPHGRSPLCLAIVDIDHFKAYNDAHGHPAGDALLRDCAALGRGAARRRHARPLRRRGVPRPPARLPRPTGGGDRRAAASGDPEGQTCSAGLAVWDPGETVDELIGRADKALYGRRRPAAATAWVCVATSGRPPSLTTAGRSSRGSP